MNVNFIDMLEFKNRESTVKLLKDYWNDEAELYIAEHDTSTQLKEI